MSTGKSSPVEVSTDLPASVAEMCCGAFDGELLLIEDIEALVGIDDSSAESTAFRSQEVVSRAVISTTDGSSVAVVRVGHPDGLDHDPIAHLDLIATDQGRRRRGNALAVLEAAEDWARDQGSDWLEVGDHLPNGLFGGVDVRWTAAMCLFESRGYRRVSVKVDLACPTITSAPARPGAGLRAERVVTAEQAVALNDFVLANEPRHADSFALAADWGTAVIVTEAGSGRVLGAGAHSLQRLGVVGPVVCGPMEEERIIIGVLFTTLLTDLSVAGLKAAEIVGAAKMTPYVEAVGARTSRVSLVLRRKLD